MRLRMAWLSSLLRRPARLAAVVLLLAGLGWVCLWGGRQLWARSQYRSALADLAHYRPAQAQGRLEKCLAVWPDSAVAHLLAAQAARQAGDFDAAELHLEAHARLHPEPSEERALEWAMLRAQNGDLETVEEPLLTRVSNDDPKARLILEALVEGNLRMYRFVAAMSCLEIWLNHEPDNPRALFLRGRSWERVGAYPRAIADYSRVVELDPDHFEARLRLVNALIQHGKHEEALPHLERLRQERPKDPEVLVRLAFAHNGLGEAEEAERILDTLLAERPDYAPALLGRGQIALQGHRLEEAEQWLRRALAVDPFDRQSNYVYYQCLQRQGKQSEADTQAARLKRVEQDISRLIEISNKDMNQRPRDAALHHEVGAIQQRLGHAELAMRWFHSAVQLDPTYRPAHASLAEYYEGIGDLDNAGRHRELAGQPR
jgi:tetratricopeptide (TPR) repeat protein